MKEASAREGTRVKERGSGDRVRRKRKLERGFPNARQTSENKSFEKLTKFEDFLGARRSVQCSGHLVVGPRPPHAARGRGSRCLERSREQTKATRRT